MKKISLFIFLVFLSLAQIKADEVSNKVSGVVLDKLTHESLIGATIQVVGTSIGVITDYEGHFEIDDLKTNRPYTLLVRYIGYDPLELRNITVNERHQLEIELLAGGVMLQEMEVRGYRARESERALLLERKKSVVSTQSVGAKELSRKGVSDAQGAIANLAGISKASSNKNVNIRGLGDRYNTTSLNGFVLPSEDPEYKNISLDFFTTDMIQSIGVQKNGLASLQGVMTGANVNIVSKNLGQDRLAKLSVSSSLNTEVLSSDFQKVSGSDFLGLDYASAPASFSPLVYSFKEDLNPSTVNRPLTLGGDLSLGKKWSLGVNSNPLTALFLVSGHTDYAYSDVLSVATTTDGTKYKEMQGEKSTVQNRQTLMANIAYTHNDSHTLSYNFMLIHTNKAYYAGYSGMRDDFNHGDGGEGMEIRQQVEDNLLVVNQLRSSWELSDLFTLKAGVAYNSVRGLEPDRRINTLSRNETTSASGVDEFTWVLLRGDGLQQHYFSELQENDLNPRLALTYYFPKHSADKYKTGQNASSKSGMQSIEAEHNKLTFGYDGRLKSDDFTANLYNMNIALQDELEMNGLNLDQYFNASRLEEGYFRLSHNQDTYMVKNQIHALYTELNYSVIPDLDMNLGLRYAYVAMNLDYALNNAGNKGEESIEKNFLLPSLNLKYALTSKHFLRLGLSESYILPQAKEFAPFRYYDMDFASEGNKNIQTSFSYNADVKWEYYPSDEELVSASIFYKQIMDPISRVDQANAAGVLTYMNVSDQASVAGFEFELHKRLIHKNRDSQHPNSLLLGLNASYLYSYCKVDLSGATAHTGTQLEGAAPLMLNLDLTHKYKAKDLRFSTALVYNYTSSRVFVTGMQGYRDTYEQGRSTLNFVSTSQLNKHFALKLKVKNLLNPSHELTREIDELTAEGTTTSRTVTLSSYKEGLSISLGLTLTL